MLKKEANLTDVPLTTDPAQAESDVSSVLSAYKSEGDPEVYEEAYTELKKFVEGSLDIYKHELGMILYPVLGKYSKLKTELSVQCTIKYKILLKHKLFRYNVMYDIFLYLQYICT